MKENHWEQPGHVFRWVILGVVILAAIWTALSVFFFIVRPASSIYYRFYHPFFFPFGLFFTFFLIFIIFRALRWMLWPRDLGYRRYWRHRDESYYILRERYAKGEITKDQFEQMMRDLRSQTSP